MEVKCNQNSLRFNIDLAILKNTKLVKLKIQVINIINNILMLGLLCILVWQLFITFRNHEEQFESPVQFIKKNYGNDYISQYGNRFEEIKKMFPRPAHLKYVGEANESFEIGAFHFVLTQYYLSPNLVFNNNISDDTVIYNLYNSKQINPATNFHLNNGWHVVKDFNNGLIILAK